MNQRALLLTWIIHNRNMDHGIQLLIYHQNVIDRIYEKQLLFCWLHTPYWRYSQVDIHYSKITYSRTSIIKWIDDCCFTKRSIPSQWLMMWSLQYIPRNIHTVFALLCFVVVIHWLIFPYPSDLLHWHCGNLTISPVPAKQPWWIWINTSSEFIMNDCITTTKQSTTKPCA